jgi:hypothetical protein
MEGNTFREESPDQGATTFGTAKSDSGEPQGSRGRLFWSVNCFVFRTMRLPLQESSVRIFSTAGTIGRENTNPQSFQPSTGVIRTMRDRSVLIAFGNFATMGRGVDGISRAIREARRKLLRTATSAPPALSFSITLNSINSWPSRSRPRTKTGIARGNRGQRRRSDSWGAREPGSWYGMIHDSCDHCRVLVYCRQDCGLRRETAHRYIF